MVSRTTSTAGQPPIHSSNQSPTRAPSSLRHAHLAGFVGLFTGIGALLALGVFLPIPNRLQRAGVTPENALADTYYIVATTAIVVAIACYCGFGGAPINPSDRNHELARGSSFAQRTSNTLSYIPTVLKLGVTEPSLGLGFLASFVARSSSIGITLFIPLFVNASLCDHPAHGVEDVKTHCRKAYVIAAQLSGVSQLFALVCAPLFGYFPFRHRHFHIPLMVAALSGAAGYVLFARMNTTEISPPLIVVVALLGISQIGAIVHSLSLVSSFVTEERQPTKHAGAIDALAEDDDHEETSQLLSSNNRSLTFGTHEHLKGTIAGVYSFAGSLAILILTKVGGVMFDGLGPKAPFYLLSAFNVGLLLAVIASGMLGIYKSAPGKK
ncbi:MAG: hypothetical protein Q9169_001514 [Polycauliona sp. 2 TL-2023]